MKRLTKKTLKKIVLEVIDEAKDFVVTALKGGYGRGSKRYDWIVTASSAKKAEAKVKKSKGRFRSIAARPTSDFKGLDPYKVYKKLKESGNEADNGKPFPGKKDDEKKDSEDSKIAVPSDNPYDTEVNARNEMKIPEQKLREFIRAVIGESTKFDHDKVQAMVDNDKYLNRAYKAIRGNDKTKLLRIFTTFILGDPKAERVYKKIK